MVFGTAAPLYEPDWMYFRFKAPAADKVEFRERLFLKMDEMTFRLKRVNFSLIFLFELWDRDANHFEKKKSVC